MSEKGFKSISPWHFSVEHVDPPAQSERMRFERRRSRETGSVAARCGRLRSFLLFNVVVNRAGSGGTTGLITRKRRATGLPDGDLLTHVQVTSHSLRVSETKSHHLATLACNTIIIQYCKSLKFWRIAHIYWRWPLGFRLHLPTLAIKTIPRFLNFKLKIFYCNWKI